MLKVVMSSEKNFSFAGSVVVFFVLLFVYSKWGPSIPVNITTQEKGEPFVVSGEGKVTIVPDTANISLGFEETGQNLKTTQNKVSEKSDILVKELKKIGIEEKDIKTVSYNVYPEYDYESPQRNVVAYRVSTTYRIKVREFEKINEILNQATSVGVNTIGSISFEVNEDTKEEKLQEAREIAISEAKQKAKGLASASGITLGKIINVTENENHPPVSVFESRGIMADTETPVAKPEIAPGETEISTVVNLYYEIR